MKKTQNFVFVLLVGLVLVPSLAYASWWNPFTWFAPKKAPIVVSAPQISPAPAPAPVVIKKPSDPKKVVSATVVSTPVVVTPPPEPPAPAPIQTPPTPPALTAQDFNVFADKAIGDLQNLQSQIETFTTAVNSDLAEFGSDAPTEVSAMNSTIYSAGVLQNNVSSAITVLQNDENNSIDYTQTDLENWETTGVPQAAQNFANLTEQLVTLETSFSQILDQIKSIVANTPPTPTPSPAEACATEEQNDSLEIRNQMNAAGGFALESQVDGQVENLMKSHGFGYCFYANQ